MNPQKTKISILVVDDVQANTQLLAAILKKEGYRPTVVSSGKEAIKQAKSFLPNLILLDIKMPEMNGFDVCQRLKSDTKTKNIPIIFISALNATSDIVKGFSIGGIDYITKPFKPEEVLARVKNQLSIQHLQKQLLDQNIKLQQENIGRVKAEKKLIRLNAELEKRVLKRTKDLHIEQQRAERLLLNILPRPIAERLKNTHENIADNFNDATVLFADIVNFTKLSANFTSDETVKFLNRVFTAFDQLAEKHGLEKIKTIGDAYMVVGGLFEKGLDHAEAIVEMALDMQKATERLSRELGIQIKVRIGINSGPVTAGVIGQKRFIYDLWGDAVNTASRMESYGLAGYIQVTEETRKRLMNRYLFNERGILDIKGKGKMKTYLLKSRLMPHSTVTLS